jgi:hypothetical protein
LLLLLVEGHIPEHAIGIDAYTTDKTSESTEGREELGVGIPRINGTDGEHHDPDPDLHRTRKK